MRGGGHRVILAGALGQLTWGGSSSQLGSGLSRACMPQEHRTFLGWVPLISCLFLGYLSPWGALVAHSPLPLSRVTLAWLGSLPWHWPVDSSLACRFQPVWPPCPDTGRWGRRTRKQVGGIQVDGCLALVCC